MVAAAAAAARAAETLDRRRLTEAALTYSSAVMTDGSPGTPQRTLDGGRPGIDQAYDSGELLPDLPHSTH